MSSTITNEQPVSKRQRIDSAGIVSDEREKKPIQRAFAIVSNGNDKNHILTNSNAPPDILPTTSYGTISANKMEMFSNANATINNSDTHSIRDSDELDNAAATVLNQLNDINTNSSSNGHHDLNAEFPDLLKMSNLQPQPPPPPSNTTATITSGIIPIADSTTSNSRLVKTISASTTLYSDQATTSSNYEQNSPSCSKTNETSHRNRNRTSSETNLDEFQLHLMKQCLCDISDRLLRRPFESHCYKDLNGIKHVSPLNEWPDHKLIQFLSNIQFLFDIYLKQNAKGQICARIMKECDALVCNEQTIIDKIFQLYEYNNKFVQFLAGRVIASCMVIAKDKKELYESWLTTLVANLVSDHNIRKITFSLEIILRILEWRDIDEHPLEDTLVIDGRAVDTDDEQFTLPLVVPPIENNYFAVQFNAEIETTTNAAPMTTSNYANSNSNERTVATHKTIGSPETETVCHIQTLSDSESFDTTDLKCNIVCALKNKWAYLVDSMSICISELHLNRNMEYTENTILTFLTLWERIISVQANLSVDSTLPFHEKLTIFEEILIKGDLPVPIYKQILTLFNESLCYGTTLALQSVLPEETNRLANEIFNSVKSQRIFNSLPVQENEPENDIGFIGYKRATITYPRTAANGNDDGVDANEDDNDDDDDDDDDECNTMALGDELLLKENGHKTTDYILLQKLVLLILKAIAVTVKPVRGDDSSDSSMDGCNSNSSTDYEAYQATVQIERATRDVLKKLNQFMKNKLNHHPETHFSKMVVHLFADQDDYLIEAMVCMLDTTTAFLPRQPFGSSSITIGRNQFRALIDMLSPVYSFLEFLELISNKTELLLDLLVSNETCFLLYLLRFLKYIRSDWPTFQTKCNDWLSSDTGRTRNRLDDSMSALDRAMAVLIRLRLQIERLVLQSLYPYDISPIIDLLHQCENLYEGNDNELF